MGKSGGGPDLADGVGAQRDGAQLVDLLAHVRRDVQQLEVAAAQAALAQKPLTQHRQSVSPSLSQ